MRQSSKIKVSPEILRKIRISLGYTENELAKKLGVSLKKIKNVEAGKDYFTINQLKKLSSIYQIPLVTFFTGDIPEIPKLVDYRINRKKRISPSVYTAIRWAKYVSEEIKDISGLKSKIPNFTIESPEELAKEFRLFLGFEETPEFKGSEEFLDFYKNLLEDKLNILIMEYPLKATDVRAFSIYSDLSVIVLNESDNAEVKLFSLIHEIGHLLRKDSGICTIDVELEDKGVEWFCNEFAGEFLAPTDEIRILLPSKRVSKERIKKVARRFGVSTQVMMLRLLKLGYITKEQYWKFKSNFDKHRLEKAKGGFRDWKKVYFRRLSKLALREINKAYRKGDLSFYEAMTILGIKMKYAEELLG